MADNSQKTPFALTINQHTTRRIVDAIQLAGKALPVAVTVVDGQIVTVRFLLLGPIFTLPEVRLPIFGPEYARSPTQVGDLGVVFPIDVYLGGVSGLGGGVADLTQRANLATLVFFPVGNASWAAVDPSVYTLYGPGGVTLRDSGSASRFLLTPSDVTIDTPGSVDILTATVNLAGTGGRAVARVGDAVSGGVITSGSTKVFAT